MGSGSTWSTPIAEVAGPAVRLVVGRVGRPHGVRGELTVQLHTDEPEQRFRPDGGLDAELPGGARQVLTVRTARWHSGRFLVHFDGVADRHDAEALRGTVLTVDSAELGELADPDEFYDHQLVGVRAELADGTAVGTVTEVVHGPGGELLVVAREGRPDALVPFVRAIVPTVDLPSGRLVLSPPDGLLD